MKLFGLGLLILVSAISSAQNFAVRGMGGGEHMRGVSFYGAKRGDAIRGSLQATVMTPRGALAIHGNVVRMDLQGDTPVVVFAAAAIDREGHRFHVEGRLTDGGAPENDGIAFVISDPAGNVVFRGATQRQTVELRRG
ncbi:MAG: hypothetical protein JSS66_03130 [Armatimonadetes bacterium]|nr:hypothetical protein [Armatimonadota bacterium]